MHVPPQIQNTKPQPQTQIQTQTPKEIIIPHQAKIFPYWHRQGPAYIDESEVRVIAVRGRAMYSVFDKFTEEYPYRKGGRVAIIPTNETEVIIIRIRRDDNTVDPEEHTTEYYVFIKGYGWWRFANNDATRVSPDKIEPEKISDIREIQEDDYFI